MQGFGSVRNARASIFLLSALLLSVTVNFQLARVAHATTTETFQLHIDMTGVNKSFELQKGDRIVGNFIVTNSVRDMHWYTIEVTVFDEQQPSWGQMVLIFSSVSSHWSTPCPYSESFNYTVPDSGTYRFNFVAAPAYYNPPTGNGYDPVVTLNYDVITSSPLSLSPFGIPFWLILALIASVVIVIVASLYFVTKRKKNKSTSQLTTPPVPPPPFSRRSGAPSILYS